MALRDDLIDLVDSVRDEVIDQEAGLRLHAVQTRLRSWSGGEPGAGSATDTDTTLSPTPRVRPPSPRLEQGPGGKVEEGDRIVDRLSATLDEADLTGGTLSGGQEFYWLIDGEPYRVVGQPQKRFLEWRVHLRRMRNR